MTATILTILAAVVGLVVYLIKREVVQHDDPKTQNENRIKQAEKDIAKRDGLSASTHGLDDLNDLDRL